MIVEAILTQGHREADQWITEFTLGTAYSYIHCLPCSILTLGFSERRCVKFQQTLLSRGLNYVLTAHYSETKRHILT